MKTTVAGRFHPEKILIPLDFSPSSDAASLAATELAEEFGAELLLLHVVPMLPDVTGIFFARDEELLERMRAEAEGKLRAKVEELERAGRRASYSVETGNDVVGNILFVLEREKADMVVLSTHGLSGWRPVVFGSIAEKVLKLAKCPVLLLPTPCEVEEEELAPVRNDRSASAEGVLV